MVSSSKTEGLVRSSSACCSLSSASAFDKLDLSTDYSTRKLVWNFFDFFKKSKNIVQSTNIIARSYTCDKTIY